MVVESGTHDLRHTQILPSRTFIRFDRGAGDFRDKRDESGIRARAQAGGAAGSGQVETLDPITVTGPETSNTMERQPSLDRLPSSIQDTPQGISVVPQELIEEKNITTLRKPCAMSPVFRSMRARAGHRATP